MGVLTIRKGVIVVMELISERDRAKVANKLKDIDWACAAAEEDVGLVLDREALTDVALMRLKRVLHLLGSARRVVRGMVGSEK